LKQRLPKSGETFDLPALDSHEVGPGRNNKRLIAGEESAPAHLPIAFQHIKPRNLMIAGLYAM
jgi:hypothetical protein